MPKQKARELVRFGGNVRKLRETRGWTQEQLAEKADLDQTYISGIEKHCAISHRLCGGFTVLRPVSRGCGPRTGVGCSERPRKSRHATMG
jgi:DNA-binding XRE family transcriptional regulator